MKTIIFLVLFSSSIALNAQGLEMRIEINRTEFNKYSRESDDTLIITCFFTNTWSEPVLFRFSEKYFMLKQNDDNGYGHSHCFRVYPAEYKKIYNDFYERTKEDFFRLSPGEEFIYRGAYSVSWLCRGAPPEGEWKLNMSYQRDVKAEDNYYLLKNYYIDKADTVFVKDAWTGMLSSNSVEFAVK
jgi:hypothetical protein